MVVGQSELGWEGQNSQMNLHLVSQLFFFFLLLNSKLLQTQQPKRALGYHLTVFEGQQSTHGLAGSFAERLLTRCKSSARAGGLVGTQWGTSSYKEHGSWQDSVIHGLLDSEPQFLAGFWPEDAPLGLVMWTSPAQLCGSSQPAREVACQQNRTHSLM